MSRGSRKPRTIICEGCGVAVVTIGSRTRWCKECAKKQVKVYEARHREKMRREKPLNPEDASIWFHDSPEDIQMCLSCKRAECRNCLDYKPRYRTDDFTPIIAHLKEALQCQQK